MVKILIMGLMVGSCLAKDFGVIGHTFPIIEENLLAFIQRRLSHLVQRGEISAHQKRIQENIEKRIKRPTPVVGLTKAQERRTWRIDPTFSFPIDIKDSGGSIFYKKGTRVNPLKLISLSKSLLFIDGDDPQQVEWAVELFHKVSSSKPKIILTNGSPFDLENQHGIRFYFDQGGKLTHKWGILHTPAEIKQREDLLVAEEIPLKEEAKK